MKKHGDVKKVKRLLERCLDEGFNLHLFLPYENLRNPTWDEVRSYALEAYATALEDVLNALDGGFDNLEDAASDDGRLLVKYGDEDLFMERLEELRNQLNSSLDDREKKG